MKCNLNCCAVPIHGGVPKWKLSMASNTNTPECWHADPTMGGLLITRKVMLKSLQARNILCDEDTRQE